jgi:hypothetical protein
MIADIWRSQPGAYFCISTKSVGGSWHDEFFARSELGEVAEYIRECRERNVFWCPHGLARRRRRKEDAVMPTLLWADIDGGVDPRKLKLRPTIAIESSPGRYVAIWECDSVVSEQLNQRLTYHIGADKGGWDLSQALRAPGTINYKYAPPARTKLLWSDGPDYRVKELERLLPPVKERGAKAVRPVPAVSVKASASAKELMRQFGVKNIYMGRAGDRSRAIYGIWSPMIEGGATLEQIERVLEASWSWQSKLAEGGRWCEEEIGRIERALG